MAGLDLYDDTANAALTLDDAVIALGISGAFPEQPPRVSSELLQTLRKAGTAHLYVDSADCGAIEGVATTGDGYVLDEVDGNTINQPLLAKALKGRLEGDRVRAWARALRRHEPGLSEQDLVCLAYTILLARTGGAIVKRLAAGRPWQASLQLHMDGVGDVQRSVQWGRSLRSILSSALVKIPFAPHAPECFLIARDLERQGVPVNLTSTFSPRQVVAGAVLANVSRTNVFSGRIDASLSSERAGAEACLSAQRALQSIRGEHGCSTQLIVASIRDTQTIVQTAGCDAMTAPPDVLSELLGARELGAAELESRLEVSYRDDLGLSPEAERRLGVDRVDRLFDVEPDFVEFLTTYGRSDSFAAARDGEAVARRFDEAGFGDFFAFPSESEWRELARSKVPEIREGNVHVLDTELSLRANADFATHQRYIDEEIRALL